MSEDNSLEGKIRKQIEFYFSDSNLPRDKFMKDLVTANEDGYVGLEKIASFNKLKAITQDMKVIVDALEKSQSLKLNSDRSAVKRVTPVGTVAQIVSRSIYAKGWPEDTTIESVTDTYEKAGFKVLSVRLRRMKNKTFKGSAFIELESPEEAARALTVVTKVGDTDLLLYLKPQYHEVKREERIKLLQAKNDAEKAAVKKDEKKAESAEVELTDDGKRKLAPDADSAPKRQKTDDWEKGLLVKFANAKEDNRNGLKDMLATLAEVAWVDFDDATRSGVARFKESQQEKVKELVAKLTEESAAAEGDVKASWTLLEGEEEEAHWKKVIEARRAPKEGGRGGRGGRGRGGGGRGGGRGRGRGRGRR